MSKRIAAAAIVAAFLAAPAVAADEGEMPKTQTVSFLENCPDGYSPTRAYVHRANHTVGIDLPVMLECTLDEATN